VSDYRELANELLKSASRRGASGADVLLVEDESFSVQVRLRDVETVKNAREKRLGLRVCFGPRSASTSTSDLSPASLDRLLDDTVAMAQAVAEDPENGLPDGAAFTADMPDLGTWDGEAGRLSMAERLGLATAAESAALDRDPRITNSEGGEFSQQEASVLLANTHGFVGEYRASRVGLAVTPVAEQDGAKQRDGWSAVERALSRLPSAEVVGRTAAERTLRRLGARKVRTQEAPVVFEPETAVSLLRTLCSAASGSALYRSASFLLGKLSQRVAAPGLTVIDDGRLPGKVGSRPFDGEGLPTRRTVVVEDGILTSYLLDTYSARKLGLRSTGNASRSLGQPPGVGPTNFYAVPGPHSPEEILASVQSGLYVTELIGFGVNLVTGDYSRGAAGIWIENGRLAYPVEEITIAGNLRDMLTGIEMVGSDLTWRGSFAAPTLKIGRMTVAGA
jgi:PmbA protein